MSFNNNKSQHSIYRVYAYILSAGLKVKAVEQTSIGQKNSVSKDNGKVLY